MKQTNLVSKQQLGNEEGIEVPKKPMKPCAWPGCPRLTDGAYCKEHGQLAARRDMRDGRSVVHQLRYGGDWQRLRSAYVSAHPLCERCLRQGRYVAVEEVHHVVPLKDGGTNEWSNLVSLCRKCHAEVHAEMGSRDHNEIVYEMNDSHHV